MDTTMQRCRDALEMLGADGDMVRWTAAHTVALRDAVTLLAAERKDAERYRWLRLQDWDTSRLAVVANPRAALKLGHDAPSRDRLDAMIDVHLAEVQGFLDHTLDGLDLGPNVL